VIGSWIGVAEQVHGCAAATKCSAEKIQTGMVERDRRPDGIFARSGLRPRRVLLKAHVPCALDARRTACPSEQIRVGIADRDDVLRLRVKA
jgi:hypothetical protein